MGGREGYRSSLAIAMAHLHIREVPNFGQEIRRQLTLPQHASRLIPGQQPHSIPIQLIELLRVTQLQVMRHIPIIQLSGAQCRGLIRPHWEQRYIVGSRHGHWWPWVDGRHHGRDGGWHMAHRHRWDLGDLCRGYLSERVW